MGKNKISQKYFFNINSGGKRTESAEVLQTKRKDSDEGSPEVQIALMTSRIKRLTIHLQEHKHDYSTKNGLTKIIGKRSRLLRYLERKKSTKIFRGLSITWSKKHNYINNLIKLTHDNLKLRIFEIFF